jgi:hypothetical protein
MLNRMASTLSELNACRDMLLLQNAELLIEPLSKSLETDFKPMREAKERYERTQRHFEAFVQRRTSQRDPPGSSAAQPPQSPPVASPVSATSSAGASGGVSPLPSATPMLETPDDRVFLFEQQKHRKSSLALGAAVNDFLSRQQFAWPEMLLQYVTALKNFFHRGFEAFNEMEPGWLARAVLLLIMLTLCAELTQMTLRLQRHRQLVCGDIQTFSSYVSGNHSPADSLYAEPTQREASSAPSASMHRSYVWVHAIGGQPKRNPVARFGGSNKLWTRCFATLDDDGMLCLTRNNRDGSIEFVQWLRADRATASTPVVDDRSWVIELTDGQRVVTFQCECQIDRVRWLEALAKVRRMSAGARPQASTIEDRVAAAERVRMTKAVADAAYDDFCRSTEINMLAVHNESDADDAAVDDDDAREDGDAALYEVTRLESVTAVGARVGSPPRGGPSPARAAGILGASGEDYLQPSPQMAVNAQEAPPPLPRPRSAMTAVPQPGLVAQQIQLLQQQQQQNTPMQNQPRLVPRRPPPQPPKAGGGGQRAADESPTALRDTLTPEQTEAAQGGEVYAPGAHTNLPLPPTMQEQSQQLLQKEMERQRAKQIALSAAAAVSGSASSSPGQLRRRAAARPGLPPAYEQSESDGKAPALSRFVRCDQSPRL